MKSAEIEPGSEYAVFWETWGLRNASRVTKLGKACRATVIEKNLPYSRHHFSRARPGDAKVGVKVRWEEDRGSAGHGVKAGTIATVHVSRVWAPWPEVEIEQAAMESARSEREARILAEEARLDHVVAVLCGRGLDSNDHLRRFVKDGEGDFSAEVANRDDGQPTGIVRIRVDAVERLLGIERAE